MKDLEDSGGNSDALMAAKPNAPQSLPLIVGEELSPTAESLGLSGKYEILSVVGQGGMSVVYKARHKFTEQVLAIKMLKGDLSLDKTHRARFIQEARAMEKLDHPNIVSARDVDYTSFGKPYLAMLFLDGSSISDCIKNDGPIEVSRAIRIFLQCCDALEHAHKNGVIHRDIKPSNIVLVKDEGSEDVAKIVDFGIAKLVRGDDAAGPSLTQTGDVFGSPLYMSPEQCAGQPLDLRSDIYSFGCVMYESLTGKAPFEGNSSLEVIQKHINEIPQPVTIPNCAPAVCKRLDQIIYKALEKDLARRYQSMAELKNDLAKLNDATEYSGANGITYASYARAHHRFTKSIVRHPYRFAAVVASMVALTAAAMWSQNYVAPLTEPPTLMAGGQWVWDEAPVKPKPMDYQEKIRRGSFVIAETQRRHGFDTPDSFKRRWKLAAVEEQYGDYDLAAGQLEYIVDAYQRTPPENQWQALDVMQEYALCEYRMKDYPKAAKWFGKAWERFEQGGAEQARAVGNNFLPKLAARYANSLRMTGDYEKAKSFYQRALGDPSVLAWRQRFSDKSEAALIDAMCLAGMADCNVQLARGDTAVSRSVLLDQAKDAYNQAEKTWQERSSSNPEFASNVTLCKNGKANANLVAGNYAAAASELAQVVKEPLGKNLMEQPAFRLNYARVLWRSFDFLKAIATANKSP